MTNPRLVVLEENFKKNGGSYQKIPIKEIFSIKKGVRLTKQKMISGNIPFVGASSKDNGITNFISNNEKIHAANTITVTYNGSVGQAFYQPMPFWASDDVNVLYPLFNLTKNAALYFITILKRQGTSYGYSYKWNLERMQDDSIEIPITKDGEPDTDFMADYVRELEADYVRELEADYVRELEAYLTSAGLNDCTITQSDLSLLEENKEWKEFKICDLFNVKNTQSILKSQVQEAPEGVNYLSAKEGSNSVAAIVKESSVLTKDKGDCVFIGGKTLVVTYQGRDFYSNDSHNLALHLKKIGYMSENVGLFLTTSVYKSLKPLYNWGNSISSRKIKKDVISLPLCDGINEIDWEYFDNYIEIIKKLVIADVVKFKDEYLAQTKKVVNEA